MSLARKEMVVAVGYKEGRIALRDASDLLKLSLSETIDLLAEMGVKENSSQQIKFIHPLIQALWEMLTPAGGKHDPPELFLRYP